MAKNSAEPRLQAGGQAENSTYTHKMAAFRFGESTEAPSLPERKAEA